MQDVMLTFPKNRSYSVLEKKEGDFVDFFCRHHTGKNRRVIIDFACRTSHMETYPSVLACFTGVKKEVVDLTLPTVSRILLGKTSKVTEDTKIKYNYVGSKMVIYVRDTNSLAFYKEDGKKMDFVGGTQEVGETPLDCLKREVMEEVGIALDLQRVIYLGESNESATNDLSHTVARSYVYLLTVESNERIVENMIPLPIDFIHKMTLDDYQPWVLRIIRTVKISLGSLENLRYLDKTVVVAPNLEVTEWLRKYRAIPLAKKSELFRSDHSEQKGEWRQKGHHRNSRLKFKAEKRPKERY